jgi:hypothetical protein
LLIVNSKYMYSQASAIYLYAWKNKINEDFVIFAYMCKFNRCKLQKYHFSSYLLVQNASIHDPHGWTVMSYELQKQKLKSKSCKSMIVFACVCTYFQKITIVWIWNFAILLSTVSDTDNLSLLVICNYHNLSVI